MSLYTHKKCTRTPVFCLEGFYADTSQNWQRFFSVLARLTNVLFSASPHVLWKPYGRQLIMWFAEQCTWLPSSQHSENLAPPIQAPCSLPGLPPLLTDPSPSAGFHSLSSSPYRLLVFLLHLLPSLPSGSLVFFASGACFIHLLPDRAHRF